MIGSSMDMMLKYSSESHFSRDTLRKYKIKRGSEYVYWILKTEIRALLRKFVKFYLILGLVAIPDMDRHFWPNFFSGHIPPKT